MIPARALLLFVLSLPVLLFAAPVLAQQEVPPPEIHGSYAPAGDCARQPRVTVNKGGVFLDTASGKSGPLPVSICYSCAGGARYDGIQIWVYVKYGKDEWGGDSMPVILMFNADEHRGALQVEHDATVKTPLGGPMASLVQARELRQCKAGVQLPPAQGASAGASSAGAATKPAPAAPRAAVPARPLAATPAKGFAATLGALLRPATLPANSFYDWRELEKASLVTWAALPPQMLDKPMSGGDYFRRAGIASLAGQQVKVLAGGARTMVMNLYFRNDGPPMGEAVVLGALREAGYGVTLARCGKLKGAVVPQWYRLTAPGRQAGILWLAPSRGTAQPWEGFSLRLDGQLPPLTTQEAAVYTDRCG